MHFDFLTTVVAAILALAMARGFFRGFMRTLLASISLVLMIVTFFILTPAINGIVGGSTNVRQLFAERSGNLVDEILEGDAFAGSDLFGASSPGEAAGAVIGSAVEALGLRDVVAERVTKVLIGITAMIITYILASLIWFILERVIYRLLRPRGKLVFFDRLLGLPLGFARGLIVVWVIFGFVYVFSFTGIGGDLLTQINGSPYLSVVQKINPLTVLFSRMLKGFAA